MGISYHLYARNSKGEKALYDALGNKDKSAIEDLITQKKGDDYVHSDLTLGSTFNDTIETLKYDEAGKKETEYLFNLKRDGDYIIQDAHIPLYVFYDLDKQKNGEINRNYVKLLLTLQRNGKNAISPEDKEKKWKEAFEEAIKKKDQEVIEFLLELTEDEDYVPNITHLKIQESLSSVIHRFSLQALANKEKIQSILDLQVKGEYLVDVKSDAIQKGFGDFFYTDLTKENKKNIECLFNLKQGEQYAIDIKANKEITDLLRSKMQKFLKEPLNNKKNIEYLLNLQQGENYVLDIEKKIGVNLKFKMAIKKLLKKPLNNKKNIEYLTNLQRKDKKYVLEKQDISDLIEITLDNNADNKKYLFNLKQGNNFVVDTKEAKKMRQLP